MYSYSLNTNLETNTCISWVRCCHTQCAVYLRENIQPPPVTADTLCPRGISTGCFEKLVSSIPKGAKMLHFIYFVYIFFYYP